MRIRSAMVMLVLIGTGCGSPADDLDAICDEATKLQSPDGPYAEMPPTVKVTAFAKAVESRLKTKEIKSAWAANATVNPEERYSLLQEAGKRAGIENWQCPALDFWAKPED